MRQGYILVSILIGILFIFSCKQNQKELYEPDWEGVQSHYLKELDTTLLYLDSLKAEGAQGENSKNYFIKARTSFKKAEPYASYLNPEAGHRANGPALPVLTDDTQRVLNPVGLQKIEESIYEGGVEEALFKTELKRTRGLIQVLRNAVADHTPTAKRFFIATQQQLMRIVSFGITGFDTPVSKLGLEETQLSLRNLYKVYSYTLQNNILEKDKNLDIDFKNKIEAAVTYIDKNKDFDSFDRYTFIKEYFNPITRSWVEIRKKSAIWEPDNDTPYNFDAPTFFEPNSFNLAFFTPAVNANPTKEQVALGEKLFFDPKLSEKGNLACATCHLPNKAYTDGRALSIDNLGSPQERNTPTLINAAYQQAFFWDGRSESLIAQINSVFSNEREFNTGVHQFSEEILKDSTYLPLFKEAFGGVSTRNRDVVKAISSYISTLDGFDSKFDQNIRGERNDFTQQEKDGFNLFMGKALCATCHFIPLTNGTVPPFFLDTEKEVIGVPETAQNKILDDDTGFYWRFEKDIHYGMFKTPTVRNVAVTGPYMHNGVYDSLIQVVDFYNKGGGAGLGFDLPHQTLPFDNLDLTEAEQQALVAFMETLTDVPEEGEY